MDQAERFALEREVSNYVLLLLFASRGILPITSEVCCVGRHSYGQAHELIISKIDDLKDFYIQTKQDLDSDIQALTLSHEKLAATLETYTLNHYSYHKKEKISILKLTCIIVIVAILIATSGVAEVILPYIIKLGSLLF